MANTSRIRGFVPSKSLIGAPWQSLVRQYDADDQKAQPIFIGDAVTLDTDGNVIQAVSGGVILGIVVATGTSATIFDGTTGYFNPNDLGKRFLAAGDAGVVGVVPAEAALFNVYSQLALDLGTPVIGDTFDFAVGTGSTLTGNSDMALVADVNSDVKIVELNTNPDNDKDLADAQFIVKFESTENSL